MQLKGNVCGEKGFVLKWHLSAFIWHLTEMHHKNKNIHINILSPLIHITHLNSYFPRNLTETKREKSNNSRNG